MTAIGENEGDEGAQDLAIQIGMRTSGVDVSIPLPLDGSARAEDNARLIERAIGRWRATGGALPPAVANLEDFLRDSDA